MKLRILGVAACSVMAMAATGCGSGARAYVPPTTLPAATTATTAARIRPAGESIGLSDEIVRLCKLDLDGAKSAPKYDFDRTDLQAGDRQTLGRVAECLTTGALKGRALQLIGRADPRGEADYNMSLGAQRASGVADYLAHLGIERGRLGITSRGELDATGTSEAGWQLDRRVDIVLAH